MLLFWVIAWLALWSTIGNSVLSWVGLQDRLERSLIAPITGLAIGIFTSTTLNLFGLPIVQFAAPLAVGLLIVAVWYSTVKARMGWRDHAIALAAPLLIVALTVMLIGSGFWLFGTSWQGLVNGDAASNSLAASYFMKHAFFAVPDATEVLLGHDYSSLASVLYVGGGHRFGDVTLLGLSATLAGLQPDQAYMAHGLMLYVALIAASAALVYRGSRPVLNVICAILVLCVSSVGSYVFLNQLISQIGGLALLILALILWVRMLNTLSNITRLDWRGLALFSVVLAAELRAYPEALSILGIAIVCSVAAKGREYLISYYRALTTLALSAGLLVTFLSNISLPHSVDHFWSALTAGAGLRKVALAVEPVQGAFDYAFTPDAFALGLGFVWWREVVEDPWASVAVVASAIMLVTALVAVWATRKTFYALFCIVTSGVVAFALLWFKGQGFGTFKIMLLMQPFVCLAVTIVVATLFKSRLLVLLGLVLSFSALNYRVSQAYASGSTSDIHPIPGLARNSLLDKLQLAERGANPVALDLQSFLLQQFAGLREQSAATSFAGSFPSPNFAFSDRLGGYHALLVPAWFRGFDKFILAIEDYQKKRAMEVPFGCGPAPIRDATFKVTTDRVSESSKRIYAGGVLQTFNRTSYADAPLIVHDAGREGDPFLVAQRESSLGGWEVGTGIARGLYSVYFGESDPMGQVSTMSAVGRYMLLELIGTGDGPQQLRLRFTRSFFGAEGAQLPKLSLHGANSITVAGYGAGSLDVTTDPISPCVINQRRYVMIDFGAEPQAFRKLVPLVYRALGLRYSPDARRVVGFLRDISVAQGSDDKLSFVPPWAPKSGGQALGYVGLFEDGWLSDEARIVVRPDAGATRVRFVVELDPALLSPGVPAPSVTVSDSAGQMLGKTQLIAGSNMIDVAVPGSGRVDVRLKSDSTMPLPGGDGRRVAGRLVATLLE